MPWHIQGIHLFQARHIRALPETKVYFQVSCCFHVRMSSLYVKPFLCVPPICSFWCRSKNSFAWGRGKKTPVSVYNQWLVWPSKLYFRKKYFKFSQKRPHLAGGNPWLNSQTLSRTQHQLVVRAGHKPWSSGSQVG